VVYFGGHATALHLWVLAAWALAGIVGLIAVVTLRRPAPALTGPVPPPLIPAERGPVLPVGAPIADITGSGAVQPITLVVGFDDSEPARRALTWSADLLRARPGSLHVVYADHALIDSDLSGFARTEMEDAREEKAAGVAEAAKEIAATAGVPYAFERSQEPPVDAILSAARSDDSDETTSTPIIVTGRSHHAAHRIIGSVPVELLHQSPYPVLTIA
jgi:nucleotide-binding universal stress UspA family protein